MQAYPQQDTFPQQDPVEAHAFSGVSMFLQASTSTVNDASMLSLGAFDRERERLKSCRPFAWVQRIIGIEWYKEWYRLSI